MSPNQILILIGDVILMSAFPAVLLFPAFYLWRSNWRATAVGRSLVYQSLALGSVLLLVLMSVIFPGYPFRPWLRLVVYAGLSYTMWRMFFTLVRIQNERAAEADRERHDRLGPIK